MSNLNKQHAEAYFLHYYPKKTKSFTMTEKSNLTTYIISVDNLAKNKSGIIFRNTKIELAAIVLAKIIEYADKEIRIYENNLTGDIADKHEMLLQSLHKSILVGKVVKIVIRHDEENDSRAYQFITRYASEFPKNLEIRIASSEFISNVKTTLNKDINFTVGDKVSYRMETTEVEKNQRNAICCFNDPKMATTLATIFDKYYSNCQPLQLIAFA